MVSTHTQLDLPLQKGNHQTYCTRYQVQKNLFTMTSTDFHTSLIGLVYILFMGPICFRINNL